MLLWRVLDREMKEKVGTKVHEARREKIKFFFEQPKLLLLLTESIDIFKPDAKLKAHEIVQRIYPTSKLNHYS